jgi:hypothetical protein
MVCVGEKEEGAEKDIQNYRDRDRKNTIKSIVMFRKRVFVNGD